MKGLNKIHLIGRLGADPEKRLTPYGKEVTNISLAVTEPGRGEETQWFRVLFWEKLADLAETILRKGNLVHIEGRVKFNKWNDGKEDKLNVEIIASSFLSLESKKTANDGDSSGMGHNKTASSNVFDEESDDDIPF